MSRLRSRTASVLWLVFVVAACSGNPSDSTEALRLVEDHRVTDSELLLVALREGTPQERLQAARAAGRIQVTDYAGPLAQAARSDLLVLRLEALFALGQLGLPEGVQPSPLAVEAVTDALADSDAEIVAAATEALGKLAPEGAADRIVPLLAHLSPKVRREAATALFRLRFVPVWRKQTQDPPPLPAAAVRALAASLKDPAPEVRQAAAHGFSRYGEPEAVHELTDALEDGDVWVRLFAARAIGRSGIDGAAPALVRALGDDDLHVRAEAISALARLELVFGYPADLETDPSLHVRAALARALGQAVGDDSLARLRRLAEDASPTVRAAAIESLAARRGDEAAETLLSLLNDEAWTIRAAAVRAAPRIGEQGGVVVDRALADPDVRVRVAALESAAESDPASETILAMLESEDLALRGTALGLYAEHATPPALEVLRSVYDRSSGVEWIEIREAVVDALADTEGARPLLERVAGTDRANSVRGKARRALGAPADPVARDASPQVATSPWLDLRFDADPIVELQTTKGTFTIRCLAQQAPNHVAAFVERVRDGFYDGLEWHRVVTNFVIQGGDPRGDGWGSSGPSLRDEINRRPYDRGVVGMPKAGKDTGSCQLFVTHVPTPHLDGNYTVFGVVESGLEVIDEIEVGDRILRARVR